MLAGLNRAARRRLQRGALSLERITLDDGRWIEIFARRAERRPGPDYDDQLSQVLASFVARTNVTATDGTPIDPADPAAWRALDRATRGRFAAHMIALVKSGKVEDDDG